MTEIGMVQGGTVMHYVLESLLCKVELQGDHIKYRISCHRVSFTCTSWPSGGTTLTDLAMLSDENLQSCTVYNSPSILILCSCWGIISYLAENTLILKAHNNKQKCVFVYEDANFTRACELINEND